MTFQGENLVPGNIGHFFVLLSFVASFIGALSFFLSSQSKLDTNKTHWYNLGRLSFGLHSLSVFSIFGILFYIIFNHRFEYHYVWSHSSLALPFKYLLSCFWEGQEGSFLLWMIWHAVLGLFYLRKKTEWTAPVMSVVSLAQFFLSISLLGLFFFGEQIGSSPFALLRDVMKDAPVFQRADYLSLIQDGNGLNPLLQNYWMVIHPPVLFLGFASTLFPFAYAVAGLWQKKYDNAWIKSLIQWSLFGAMILGTGIMMGGAWAYESLNFGGYWAWDPVENSSLVPWIVLIAGLHTAVIYKSTKYSLRSTLLFLMLSFVLVLYSTFLTRTGILGDTSVHAFTGEGNYLGIYLVLFLSVFFLGGLILFFWRYKSIPDHKKEEELSSREFWMFIGSLVLIISIIQITYTTSMPVWNKIFGTKLTITDPIAHYNKIQIWIAMVVALGTATIYYLKYKKTGWVTVLKKLSIPFATSVIIASCVTYFQSLTSIPVAILMYCSVFAVTANAYFIFQNKMNFTKWGGNMAHIGFGLMLVGIILSSFNKKVISINRLGVELPIGKEDKSENIKESRENVLLFRDTPIKMDAYKVTYKGDTVIGPNHFYEVKYTRQKNDTGRILEEFTLHPNAQLNPKMGLVANPDTKHYLTKDIFTYLTVALDKTKTTDTAAFKTKEIKLGDSVYFSNGVMVFNGFDKNVNKANYKAQSGDIAVTAKLQMMDLKGNSSVANPLYYIREKTAFNPVDTVRNFNLYVRVNKIIPEREAIEIAYRQPSAMDDYIIMKAIVFPYINILWIGTILMILGFLLSLFKRITTK